MTPNRVIRGKFSTYHPYGVDSFESFSSVIFVVPKIIAVAIPLRFIAVASSSLTACH